MSVWPENYQAAATITVNFDAESVEQRVLPGEPLWGRFAFGRYGAQLGVYRILETLERYGVRATFFIPGFDADRYPAAMEAIAKAGHEVAGRGYAYEDFSALEPSAQEGILQRSEETFQRVFGGRPQGWRAPDGLMTAETRGILAARGYRFESTYCDDDVPYVVADAAGNKLVELPQFHTTAVDRHYYQVHRSPLVVSEAWREELSAMYEVGGLFNLAIHPRGDYGSGRGVRVRALADLLQAMRETPRLWIATCGEIASWTLEATPADEVRAA
jgi:peptidoglycan/xylan/chitin deacetylase (PgdA/CDA1 family)